ncbi:MAG: hypothetical protein ACI4JM_02980 [Oscillospiraceae bacterium]
MIYRYLESANVELVAVVNNKYILGDADNDGKITSADVLVVLQNVVGITTFTEAAAK